MYRENVESAERECRERERESTVRRVMVWRDQRFNE